jgi:hypothetical protein
MAQDAIAGVNEGAVRIGGGFSFVTIARLKPLRADGALILDDKQPVILVPDNSPVTALSAISKLDWLCDTGFDHGQQFNT